MKTKVFLLFLIIVSASSLFAQSQIKGIIKRSNGMPVPHATVLIRGTGVSVSADESGGFTINSNLEPPFFLQVSSIGYKAQDFQILKLTDYPLELVLLESALLDEIVVTSRRRSESLQEVPIPISVVGGTQIEQSGA